MSKSQAIHSNIIFFFARYAQYLYNILGKKQPWNWGKMGFLPRMLVGSRSVTRRREREKSLYTYQQKTVRGSREGWARHFLSHAIPFIIEFVSASRRCGIKTTTIGLYDVWTQMATTSATSAGASPLGTTQILGHPRLMTMQARDTGPLKPSRPPLSTTPY